MDRREQERQNHLGEARILIRQAMDVPETEFSTIIEYRYKRWNLTMKAIYALLKSLRVHSDEIDTIGDTVIQASAVSGWKIT